MKKKGYDQIIESIPQKVVNHLNDLLESCEITINKKNLKRAAQTWLTKRGLFDRIIEHGKFERVTTFNAKDPGPCIAITLSGSIITLGPLVDGERQLIYTSIKIRKNVPDIYEEPKSVLNNDIVINEPIKFDAGFIKQTSSIVDMAVISDEKNLEKQFSRIRAANSILQNRFVEINRDFIALKEKDDDISNRNNLFDQWIILDWFRIGGVDEIIFYGRSKILWLELFTDLYNFLTDHIVEKNERDSAFLDLENKRFSDFIDVYKWIESEKKDFDIGLMKAMEEIPEIDKYKEFCAEYKNEILSTIR